MWPFKKKQKTISVNEFLDQVKAIAAEKGKTYCAVKVELCSNPSPLQDIKGSYIAFNCYVDGYNWHRGKTVDDAIALLRSDMFGKEMSEATKITI